VAEKENEYQSSVDYAEFLAQSLKEELGIDVMIGSKKSTKIIYFASCGFSAPLQIGSCGGECESRRAELLSPSPGL
ncbi:MAG: hypothetical protein IJ993_03185, partial [Akkermansia sp.]|nr:hypothetical protein [Akkermansia sp.]